MAFTYTWNGTFESQPADTEDLSIGASRMRDHKKAISERAEIDHNWNGGADDGQHKKITFGAQIVDPANVANKGFLYTKDVAAKVELFWEDEDGNVYQITSAGRLLVAANIQAQTYEAFDDSGVADAYVITPVPAITAYAKYQRWVFKAANACTGASTLNVSAVGVRTIKKNGGVDDLEEDDIVAGQIVVVDDDGTNLQMVSSIASLGTSKITTYNFTDNTNHINLPTAPTKVLWSTEQTIVLPTSGFLQLYFYGRINLQGSTSRRPVIGLRINGTDYWPSIDEGGSIVYAALDRILFGSYNIYKGGSYTRPNLFHLDIEGHGISTGSVAAQPIIAQEAGTTMDLVGATVISRLKVVVTDTT